MLDASEPSFRQKLGTAGEYAVGQWLQKKGFTIIAYNYRLSCGEIDLIAAKNEIITFVEVKVRTTDYFNSSELITLSKQKKIIKTAQKFCLQRNITHNKIYRFDIALLKPHAEGFDITYIENAFTNKEY